MTKKPPIELIVVDGPSADYIRDAVRAIATSTVPQSIPVSQELFLGIQRAVLSGEIDHKRITVLHQCFSSAMDDEGAANNLASSTWDTAMVLAREVCALRMERSRAKTAEHKRAVDAGEVDCFGWSVKVKVAKKSPKKAALHPEQPPVPRGGQPVSGDGGGVAGGEQSGVRGDAGGAHRDGPAAGPDGDPAPAEGWLTENLRDPEFRQMYEAELAARAAEDAEDRAVEQGPDLLTMERAVDAARQAVDDSRRACEKFEGGKQHGSREHLLCVLEATRAAVAFDEARLARSKATLRLVEAFAAAPRKEASR